MIKDEQFFHRYNEIWEKLIGQYYQKKINRELVQNKKFLKAEKKMNTKESFHCILKPVILIDSVYKK